MSTETEQLAALARLHEQLERHGIEYWLFGGWAVDFHAGSVTRPHDDLDIAVWQRGYGTRVTQSDYLAGLTVRVLRLPFCNDATLMGLHHPHGKVTSQPARR
jgi:aminoglycoside-2''-adenylyltransferase